MQLIIHECYLKVGTDHESSSTPIYHDKRINIHEEVRTVHGRVSKSESWTKSLLSHRGKERYETWVRSENIRPMTFYLEPWPGEDTGAAHSVYSHVRTIKMPQQLQVSRSHQVILPRSP